MVNLRDQLLKAGLIDKKARHLADQEDRKKAKAAKSDATLAAEAAQEEAARRQRLEAELEAKRQADREREAERLEQARAVERLHRVESTIDRNEVTLREGRRRFYFRAGGTKVGRFDLHGRQADDLEDGLICIVRDSTDATRPFKLMDDAGLAELRSIDPTAVIFHAPAWRPIDEPTAGNPAPADLPDTVPPAQEGATGGAQPAPLSESSGSDSGTSTSM